MVALKLLARGVVAFALTWLIHAWLLPAVDIYVHPWLLLALAFLALGYVPYLRFTAAQRPPMGKKLAILAGVLCIPYIVIALTVWQHGFGGSLEDLATVAGMFALVPVVVFGTMAMLARDTAWRGAAIACLLAFVALHFAWFSALRDPPPTGPFLVAVHAGITLLALLLLSMFLKHARPAGADPGRLT